MDSNHRPSASQTDALYRLSYTPMAEKRRFELPQDCSRHLFNPRAVFKTVYPHGCYPPRISDSRSPIVVKVRPCSRGTPRHAILKKNDGLERPLPIGIRNDLVHEDGLEPPEDSWFRLIYSQMQLPLCHSCKKDILVGVPRVEPRRFANQANMLLHIIRP